MKNKKDVFKKENLGSAITFFGLVLLYTLLLNVEVEIKEMGLILLFTIIFWIMNSSQASKYAGK